MIRFLFSLNFNSTPLKQGLKPKPTYKIALLIFLAVQSLVTHSQTVIPTKGVEFWIAFPESPPGVGSGYSTRRCDVFITSETSTSGVISIPLQGWSQNFSVTANQTTTITLPLNMVEHVAFETVDNKAVEVTTQDTVSVFAIAFRDFSSDATVVYPKQSLGTEYRISSYKGILLSGATDANSFLMIVATEDNTQISITPSVNTKGGKPAGVPFIINLNAGESYQVYGANYQQDLTGTVIEATDSSGSCRTFAVFSGTTCVNIPTGCTACDVLYDQAISVNNWGSTYYSVPFSFATSYTIRMLADQNNTIYSINGAAPDTLNTGQFNEINYISGTQCITANKPMCVIQYMQGQSCSQQGDPAMMYLNAQEQKMDHVTFSTITSTVINQHNVNVIMNSSQIGQLKLDGNPVPASSFTPLSGCSNISYADLSLSQGSHTLEADSGFTAYAYGTGGYESYAYSVGSFSKSKPVPVDSIVCSSDTMHLGTTQLIYNPWWSSGSRPFDTLGTGQVLTLTPPINPDIYILHGNEYISGCETAFYFDVEIPDPPTYQLSSSRSIVCKDEQVQLNANIIPASSIFQFSWSPTAGLNNPNIADPILTATVSGWYYVTISSPNGCAPTVVDSIYIDVLNLPLPVVNGGINQQVCAGTTAVLSVSGGVSYLWSPGGETTSSITVTPSATTDYVVSVTDTNGCSNKDTVTISLFPPLNTDLGPDQTICTGETIQLNTSGGNSYAWSPNGETSSGIIVSPGVSTVYSVFVSDSFGCTDADTIAIAVLPIPFVDAGPDQEYCASQPVTLTSTPAASYLWQPGNGTTQTIQVTPFSTTDYILRVTDSNGCQNFDTVHVAVRPLVTGTSNSQTVCEGTMVTLTDSGGVSYSWTPGANTDSSIIVSPAVTTNYIVHIVQANGCQVSDTMLVNVNPLPVANAGNDVTICLGDSTILTASGGIAYSWLVHGSPNSSVIVSPLNTQDYVVQVTDMHGCQNRDTVTVFVNPLPPADAGPDVSICPGNSTMLVGSGGMFYLWNPGGATSASISVSPASPTDYVVEVTGSNGCKKNDTARVELYPVPVAGFILPGPVCMDDNLDFINQGFVSTGWVAQNFWHFGDGNASMDEHPSHAYGNPGFYDVRLISTSNQGCVDSVEQTVYVNEKPVANFTTPSMCAKVEGEFHDLSTINNGSIDSWEWEFGDGQTSNLQDPIHAYELDGNYDVTLSVISDSGCLGSLTRPSSAKIYPLPVAGFETSAEKVSILEPSIVFYDASVDGFLWHWDFGDNEGSSDLQSPAYTYSDTGAFNVRLVVMNNRGCLDTTYGRIYVESFFSVYFPNAFTPNGDSRNDEFKAYGDGILEIEMFIFNRWGEQVYHSKGLTATWNGTTKNQACGEGVYTYLARVVNYKRIRYEYTGSVTLIR